MSLNIKQTLKLAAFLVGFTITTLCWSQEKTDVPASTAQVPDTTKPESPTTVDSAAGQTTDQTAVPNPLSTQSIPPTAPLPSQSPQNQTSEIATMQPVQSSPPRAAYIDRLAVLQKMPKRLPYREGMLPPDGYVEVRKARKGMVISGATIFGGFYALCAMISLADTESIDGDPNSIRDGIRYMSIPLFGPMIWGFGVDDTDPDVRFRARFSGMLLSMAQITGVTLFIVGLTAKKTMWLREDIAGVSFSITPTLLGQQQPGLSIIGTF